MNSFLSSKMSKQLLNWLSKSLLHRHLSRLKDLQKRNMNPMNMAHKLSTQSRLGNFRQRSSYN